MNKENNSMFEPTLERIVIKLFRLTSLSKEIQADFLQFLEDKAEKTNESKNIIFDPQTGEERPQEPPLNTSNAKGMPFKTSHVKEK